ncbi:MAG TPA: hypothetical protein VG755_09895, partial [Nannocystaceae bacterium]|nr:hypothetical protein [Nannocystaceae bacterium]
DSSTDTTPSTGVDPTASSTMSTTASTMSTTEATTTSPSTTDETADSGSSDDATTEADSGSTDDGGPLCGNNMLDGDEVCDDGNEVNGDGCNNDCIESGTLLWELEAPGTDVAVSDDDVVAVLRHDDGPHIDTFDADGSALDSVDGPADAHWYSFDFFGNGDFAVAVRGDSAIDVARISAAGAELWSSGAPGSGPYNPGTGTTDVATTDADEAAFSGNSNAAIWGGKFDGAGVFQWSDIESVAAPGWTRAISVACHDDGTCVVAGFTDANGNSSGGEDLFVRLLAPGGAAIWTATRDLETSFFQGGYVAIAPTGDVAVTGCDEAVCLAVGYTSDGDSAWTYLFDYEDLYPYGIASDVDGNFIIVGTGQPDDVSGLYNAIVRKLDANGDELWTQSFNTSRAQNDEAHGVATDSTGRIFVVGSSWLRAYAP